MKIIWFFVLSSLVAAGAQAHGPAHSGRAAGAAMVTEALDLQETAVPVGPAVAARPWGASLTTGWDSRHVHYGVNETGESGLFVNELGVQAGGFNFSVWNGFNADFVEWDFTAAYPIEFGPVFLVPGYNFRSLPLAKEDEHGGEEPEEEDAEHADDESHAHQTTGHELLLSLGTARLPYATPSANLIWDVSNTPGAFLEFRVDGDVAVYRDVVSLQPYALLGLNLGYNTRDYYGWNSFQFGVQATCRLCERISVFAGVNYSVALEALQRIDQGNEVWANTGLNIAF